MVFVRGLMVFVRWFNGFCPTPDPLERHQTLEAQGFDAVGTIFANF